MVIKGGLVGLGQLLAVQLDGGRRPDTLLRGGDAEVFGADRYASQRNETQVTVDDALLHRGELWLICLNIDVDVL